MKPTIITLFGVRGSGKDTVARKILEQLSWAHGTTESFAYPLKQMARTAFGFSDDDLFGSSDKRETMYEKFPFSGICPTCGETCMPGNHLPDVPQLVQDRTAFACPKCLTLYPRYVTPRLALQTLGTEWGRRLSPNVWVSACFRRIQDEAAMREADHRPRLKMVVITDGRFENERRGSAEYGATNVLLLRKLEDSAKATHQSERELSTIPRDIFHYVLDNTSTVEALTRLVDTMLKDLGIQL